DLTINLLLGEKTKFEVSGFYTLFRNAIVPGPFVLNERDSIIYNGVKSAVYANQNLNRGTTYGISGNVTINFTKQLSVFSILSYTHGRIKKFDSGWVPQDHIPPIYGKTSFSYRCVKWNTELFALYNGWKKIQDYNPDGEDNPQYATQDGMPSWITLNWRGNYKFFRKKKFA